MFYRRFFLVILLVNVCMSFAQKPYLGGEIRTYESFLYGRFEIRMKPSLISGTVSSLFTFYDAPDFVQNWNEIDIEFVGNRQKLVQFNAIHDTHLMHEKLQDLNFDPAKDFHTYAFEWTPTYIAWFVDSVEVYRDSGAHIKRLKQKQKIMMNYWVANIPAWVGEVDKTSLTKGSVTRYDQFSYYAYEEGVFKLAWKDDFNGINESKWTTATHSFEENLCQFDPSMVQASDGNLLLMIKPAAPNIIKTIEYTKDKKYEAKIVKVSLDTTLNTPALRVVFEDTVFRDVKNINNFKLEGNSLTKSKWINDYKTILLFFEKKEPLLNSTLIFTPPKRYGANIQKVEVLAK